MGDRKLARAIIRRGEDDEEETPEQKVAREAEAAKHIAWMENHRREQEEAVRLAVPREIAALRKEAAEKLAAADKLEVLLKEYPNLRKRTGRWNKVAFYTKDVNALVTRFDQRFNCGCCSHSPLEIWPYLETPHGNIYSDPPDFFVGRRGSYSEGDTPDKGWDSKMRDAGIPEPIIGAVGMHFRRVEEEETSEEDQGP